MDVTLCGLRGSNRMTDRIDARPSDGRPPNASMIAVL
jgi:hypothetical protein